MIVDIFRPEIKMSNLNAWGEAPLDLEMENLEEELQIADNVIRGENLEEVPNEQRQRDEVITFLSIFFNKK